MTQTVTYDLTWTGVQTVNLPEGFSVITGMVKDGALRIWVKEDSSAIRVSKEFKMFETKDEGYTAGYHYVCTVIAPDGGQPNIFMQK
jgi:hypothetical protein